MDANAWIWVALIAFLVFCTLPLFMGRRAKRSDQPDRNGRRDGSADDRTKSG